MNSPILRICPESPEHDPAIDELNCSAFGPGRFARTAYRLREQTAHDRKLSFVAVIEDDASPQQLVGSVRQTRIAIGDRPALLLGPLVVAPAHGRKGIGRELMHRAIHEATTDGHGLILLVGDLSYYSRFGFRTAVAGTISLPGPADPARLLVCPLRNGACEEYGGSARALWQSGNTC